MRRWALGLALSLVFASAGEPFVAVAQTAPSASPPVATTQFDYYVMTLSWAPGFCDLGGKETSSPECAEGSGDGFVVHGLWPERNDGSYPENCPSRPGFTTDAAWQGVIPTRDLATHEWQTHGTCTPYSADDFFKLVRKAYQSVKIPSALAHTTQQTMQPPDEIIQSFARINTGLPAGSIVLSCGRNYLTAIEVCFDRDLNPRACSGLRTCRANAVKITPQINAAQ